MSDSIVTKLGAIKDLLYDIVEEVNNDSNIARAQYFKLWIRPFDASHPTYGPYKVTAFTTGYAMIGKDNRVLTVTVRTIDPIYNVGRIVLPNDQYCVDASVSED